MSFHLDLAKGSRYGLNSKNGNHSLVLTLALNFLHLLYLSSASVLVAVVLRPKSRTQI